MSFASALGSSLLATGVQMLVLFGPFAVAVIGLNASSVLMMRVALGLFGSRVFLILFGWLGTAVHELSHALFCVLFGHKITGIKLFDPKSSDGSLGYVHHEYNRTNPYQQLGNLFIAIGPVVVGATVLTAAAIFLLGGAELRAVTQGADRLASGAPNVAALVIQIISGLKTLGALLLEGGRLNWFGAAGFCYLAIAIGSLMCLSREDAVGALPGLATAVALLFLANLVAALLTGGTLTHFAWAATGYIAMANSVMIAAVAINLAAAAVLFLISLVVRLVSGFR